MIGEQFDHGDYICGAVVNVRAKQEKISIWTRNGLDAAAQVNTQSPIGIAISFHGFPIISLCKF